MGKGQVRLAPCPLPSVFFSVPVKSKPFGAAARRLDGFQPHRQLGVDVAEYPLAVVLFDA